MFFKWVWTALVCTYIMYVVVYVYVLNVSDGLYSAFR